jgi:hypothetical protein
MSDRSNAAIREEAYRAAAAVVNKVLGRIGEDSVEQIGQVGTAARDRFRAEMGRVVDLNLDLVRNAISRYGGLLDPEAFRSSREDLIDLGSTVPGGSASSVLWLHNFDDEAIDQVGFVGSRLVASGSGSLEHPSWTFLASKVTVPPRSAVPLSVGIDVPESTLPGDYRGTISPLGREAEPIEIRLEVVAVDAVAHQSS